MKNILFFALIIIALQSCKKETGTDADNTSYPVKFVITDFTEQTGRISKSITMSGPANPHVPSLKGGINVLDYLLYDAGGNLKKHLTFHSTDANFGLISDNVSAGKYSVAIIGSIDSIGYTWVEGGTGFYRYLMVDEIGDHSRDSIFNYVNYVNFSSQDWTNWYDTFFKKLDLTVSNSNVSQSVTLNRIVSQVELNLLDALPAEATSVRLSIIGERSSYSVVNDAPAGPVVQRAPSVTTKITGNNRLNFKTSLIVINTTTPVKATIQVFGANGLIAQKTIDNIICQKNKKTILSGKLSDSNDSNSGFQIDVNTNFDSDVITGNF